MFKVVSVQEAKTLLATQPIVLDTRDEASFQRDHIPGAQRLDDALIRQLISSGKRKLTTLLYCYHGNSSKDIARMLVGMGFSDLHELSGGWQAWEREQTESANPHDVNARKARGMTPLMLAAAAGDLREVISLLNRGADMNLVNEDGNNALWLACYSGDEALVSYLIQQGIDVNHVNENGATALIYSASSGRPRMVKLLLDAAADPHTRTQDGFNALDLAADKGSFHLLRAATAKAS
ncbi:MAG: ankyrin repeat domain-containing protein [Gammaproteobacteria bacterium]